MPALSFDITPTAKGSIVPGSLVFLFGGKLYYDRNGSLYHTLDPHTGAGTLAATLGANKPRQ